MSFLKGIESVFELVEPAAELVGLGGVGSGASEEKKIGGVLPGGRQPGIFDVARDLLTEPSRPQPQPQPQPVGGDIDHGDIASGERKFTEDIGLRQRRPIRREPVEGELEDVPLIEPEPEEEKVHPAPARLPQLTREQWGKIVAGLVAGGTSYEVIQLINSLRSSFPDVSSPARGPQGSEIPVEPTEPVSRPVHLIPEPFQGGSRPVQPVQPPVEPSIITRLVPTVKPPRVMPDQTPRETPQAVETLPIPGFGRNVTPLSGGIPRAIYKFPSGSHNFVELVRTANALTKYTDNYFNTSFQAGGV